MQHEDMILQHGDQLPIEFFSEDPFPSQCALCWEEEALLNS